MNSNPTSPNITTKNIQTFRYKLSDEIIEQLVHFSKIHQYDDIHQFKMYWNNWIQTDIMSVIIKNEENSLKQKYFSGDLTDKMFKSARYYYRKKQIKLEEQPMKQPTLKNKSYRPVEFVEPIMTQIRQTVNTCQISLNIATEYQDNKETFEINGAESGVGRINDESVARFVSCKPNKHITPSLKIIIANEKTHSNIQSSTNTEDSISTITLSIFSEESSPISICNSTDNSTNNSSYKSTDSNKIKLSKQLLQHIDNHIKNIFKKDTEKNQRIQISPAVAYSQFCIDYKEEIANEICYILKNNTIPIQPEKLSSRLKKTYKNRFFNCVHCL